MGKLVVNGKLATAPQAVAEVDGIQGEMPPDPVAEDVAVEPVVAPNAEVLHLPVEHLAGPFGDTAGLERLDRSSSSPLRRLLFSFDLLSVLVAWGIAVVIPGMVPVDAGTGWLVALIVIGSSAELVAMAAQRLYLSRVSAVRSIELVRLSRSALIAGCTVLIFADAARLNIGLRRAALGAVLSFIMLAVCRGIYGSWIRAGRARGLHSRGIVIVGANDEGLELWRLLDTHPELGFRVCGVTGDRSDYDQWPRSVAYLGSIDQTLSAIASTRSNGVLVASSSLDPIQLNSLSRELLRHNVHVHLSSGLRGIAHQRLRALPLAHEPLYYLEPVRLSRPQILVKRALDLAIAGIAIIVAAPVMAVAAAMIKLSDGGTVFFRQRRIGRDGQPFMLLKLRTMVPDAEQRLDEVRQAQGNERESILFKLDRDPRRTKIGRYLEAASIDELPQLLNVLMGSMSLVGPRPALPHEVAQFDEELLARLSVPPGITGLWQVEARDNPSFSAYRRLDLFYVENWSVTLDLVLLVETATSVAARLLRSRHHASSPEASMEAPELFNQA